MYKRFASLGHSNEFAYAYDSQSFDMKAVMCMHYRQFHTYGDSLTQHSGDWGVQIEFLADYLASLAVAMQGDEELFSMARFDIARRPNVGQIAFAASVIYKTPKDEKKYEPPRYFSVKELKVSSAPNKRYDKRYEEIRDIHDGSANSIFRILVPEISDGIEKYALASAIRDWLLANADKPGIGCAAAIGPGFMGLPGEFLTWTKDRQAARQLYDAYEACWHLVQANNYKNTAEGHLNNYKRAIAPVETKIDAV